MEVGRPAYLSIPALLLFSLGGHPALGAALPPDLWTAYLDARHRIEHLRCAIPPCFEAVNPGQNLGIRFDRGGLAIRPLGTASWTWRVELSGYGTGERPDPVAPPVLESDGNRIHYRRPGLVEWYVNDATGIEQGLTIVHPPSDVGKTAVVLTYEVESDLVPRWSEPGQGIAYYTPEGRYAFTYDTLKVWDVRGLRIPAQLALNGNGIRIEIDAAQAQWPLTVDPLIQTETELNASDADFDDRFGVSVDVSGSTAVIGAPGADCPGGFDCGAAYVFQYRDDRWTEQQVLLAGDRAFEDAFGTSVGVSEDSLVVGAPGAACGAGEDCGAAYVFELSGDIWTQQQKIVAADADFEDGFGTSVDISGGSIVAGSPGTVCGAGQDCGAAYVYLRDDSLWLQQQKLVADDADFEDGFGTSVGISGDSVVIGSPGVACTGGQDCGAAYTYGRTSGVWMAQDTLRAGGATFDDRLGSAVDLNADTAVIGAPGVACAAGQNCGAAYVFGRTGNHWLAEGALLADNAGAGDAFGSSVGVSGDTAAAGAPGTSCSAGSECGTTYVYSRTNGTWSLEDRLTRDNAGFQERFGSDVGVSGDVLIAGTPGASCRAGQDCGSATAYALDAALTETSVVSSTLPTSRSVQVGQTATVFASIINTGTVIATECGITLDSDVPVDVTYNITDPTTNAVTGGTDAPAALTPGATGSFVLSLSPGSELPPTEVEFNYQCENSDEAPVTVGLNTVLLSASTVATADVIALAVTLTEDGIVDLPGPTGTTPFAVATVNVGAADTLTARADTGTTTLPLSTSLCATGPSGGCLQPPEASVTVPMGVQATASFAVFVTATGTIPFDPANNRVFVRFEDPGGAVRGATSVAVRTQ